MPRCWSFYSIISFKKLENKLIMSNYLTFNFKISFWYLQLECTNFCHKVRIFWEGHKIWKNLPLKRSIFQTFWKPDCCPNFLFFKLETSNFSYLLIFWFPLTVQSFRKIRQHWCNIFYKGPPFDVFWFCNLPKIQRGTLIKCLISMLSNIYETLHS